MLTLQQIRYKVQQIHSIIEKALSSATVAIDAVGRSSTTSSWNTASNSSDLLQGSKNRLFTAAKKGRAAALFADLVHVSNMSARQDADVKKV